jgi:hypothetical protein
VICVRDFLLQARIVKTELVVLNIDKNKWQMNRRIVRQPEMVEWNIYIEEMVNIVGKKAASECFTLNHRLVQHDSQRGSFINVDTIFDLMVVDNMIVPKSIHQNLGKKKLNLIFLRNF